jgi:hypothetical protein
MKRILLLTLAVAMVALLGGCVDTGDYNHDDNKPHETEHSQMLSAPDFNYGSTGAGGGGN